jgi:hypothetical protein
MAHWINFSSFPFENKLQKMKNLVRRGGKPLEQIVHRMWKVDDHHTKVKESTVLIRLTSLSFLSQFWVFDTGYRMVDQFKKMHIADGPYQSRFLTTAFSLMIVKFCLLKIL